MDLYCGGVSQLAGKVLCYVAVTVPLGEGREGLQRLTFQRPILDAKPLGISMGRSKASC